MSHSFHAETEVLFELMKTTKDKRMYQRYQTIHLYLQGYPKQEIASMIGRSEKNDLQLYKCL